MKNYNSLLELIDDTCKEKEYIEVLGGFSHVVFKNINNLGNGFTEEFYSYQHFLNFTANIANIDIKSFNLDKPLIVNKKIGFIDLLKKFDEYLLNFKLYNIAANSTGKIFLLEIICSDEFYANLTLYHTL